MKQRLTVISLVALAGACGDTDGATGPRDSGVPSGGTSSALTYHRDARAIIESKCVGCHQPDNIAPFSLTNFKETVALRAAIVAAVESGSMPPWQPADGCNEYANNFSLNADEKKTLLDWLGGGAKEGDPSDYTPPKSNADPFVADLELSLPEAYTPPDGPDDYRCFLVEWPEDAASYITGFRVRPDRLDMVHHVLAYIATPEQVADFRALDAADEGPGYPCFGGPGSGGGKRPYQIGSWVPGVPAGRFPKGTGIEVDPGSVMVVQMHYNTLTTKAGSDQSLMQVTLADQVERPALTFLALNPSWLQPGGMVIPAGQSEVVHTADIDVTRLFSYLGGERIGLGRGDRFVLHSVGFHMHQLGTKGSTSIVRASGNEECLLQIPKWDFNWQGSYRLQNEITVEPGDLIRIRCEWDNSAKNQTFVDGKQASPRDVSWGEGTRDEMCLSGLFVTAE